jgi:hypothetical protein
MNARTWKLAAPGLVAGALLVAVLSCTTSDGGDPTTGNVGNPGLGGVTPPPDIFDVTPDVTCATTGSFITLVGTNLVPSNDPIPSVTINGVPATFVSSAFDPVLLLDIVTVQAGAQAVPAGGVFASVTVTNDNGSDTLNAAIRLLPSCANPPRVVAADPTTGARTGGDAVSLQGSDLACVTSVQFVGTMGAGTLTADVLAVVTDQEIVVESPVAPSTTSEAFDIVVTSPCGTAVLPAAWLYTGTTGGGAGTVANATAAVPPQGPAAGGNTVQILGNDLSLATRLTIGTAVTLTRDVGFFVDASGTIIIPAMPASPAGLSLTIPFTITVFTGTTADTSPVVYTYIGQGAPTCTSFTPVSGTTDGGTVVRITGNNLRAVTGVLFGGEPGTNLNAAMDGTLLVTTPPYSAPIDVDVDLQTLGATGTDITVSTCLTAFTYIAPGGTQQLSVDTITPDSGRQSGGDLITIGGTGLDAVTRVEICGVLATITQSSAEVLTARTGTYGGTVPATCDVVVSTAAGDSATLANGFTYEPSVPDGVSFDALGARTAPAAGGTSFRLLGTNLLGVTRVSFGGTQASGAAQACGLRVQSNTQVTGIAPSFGSVTGPFPADVLVVAESAAGADSTPPPVMFRYHANPTLAGAAVAGGGATVQPGQTVRVNGTNFMPESDVFIGTLTIRNSGVSPGTSAGDDEVTNIPFTIESNTSFTFTFPPVTEVDFYDVEIETPNPTATCASAATSTLLRALFVGTPPTGTDVTPSRGRWDGNTRVTIATTDPTVSRVEIGPPGGPYVAQSIIVPANGSQVVIRTSGIAEALAGAPYDVVLTNAAGTQTLPMAYTFVADPDLFSVETTTPVCGLLSSATDPTPLPVAQDQILTISGDDLSGVDVVRIGTAVAGITMKSDTQVTVTVPAGSATGSSLSVQTDVTLTGEPGFTDTLPAVVAFQGAPSITTIAPTSGAPDTVVTITGTGLRNFNGTPVTVLFDATPATTVVQVSDTQLQVRAPAGAAENDLVDLSVSTCQGTAIRLDAYRYPCNQPVITAVNPAGGPDAGGNVVTIDGAFLTDPSGGLPTVMFGTATASFTGVQTRTQLTVQAPAGTGGTTVDVVVTTCGGAGRAVGAYTYGCPAPQARDFSPLVGISGTVVTLNGVDLNRGAVRVFFGGCAAGADATIVSASPTTLTVEAPAGTGAVDVCVRTCGGEATYATQFTYCQAPSVTAMAPASGPQGTIVTFTGTNLTDPDGRPPVVRFGTAAGTVTAASPTSVDVEVPAGTGNVQATLTTCGGSAAPRNYLYCAAPTIASIAPTTGASNTLVTITGTNLIAAGNPATVSFGGVPATVVSATATQMQVRTPAGPAGAVPVTATTCGGTVAAASLFTYCVAPTITGVAPSNGPAGTLVTITGTNLVGADGVDGTVRFGTVAATIVDSSPTALIVAAPTGPANGTTLNVRVTTCGGTSPLGPTFTYQSTTTCVAPTISGISPAAASIGALVTITGTNLVGNDLAQPTVTFGVAAATIVTATSTQVVVNVPASAGVVAVRVQTCGGTATSATPFTYCAVPTISSINPASGPEGALVQVNGTNLVGADGADPVVTFGTAAARLVNRTSTQLTVEAPAGFAANTSVSVRVSTCGGLVTAATQFIYTSDVRCGVPTVTSLSPAAGPAGVQVTISGTNLLGNDGNPTVVTFGGVPAMVITSTATRVVAVAPAGVGSVQVRLTTCGGAANAPTPFTYCTGPTITNFTPTTGPAGTDVTINGTSFLGADGGQPTVTFGTQSATVLDVTATRILVDAPAGFASGTQVSVRVTTCGGTVTAGTSFTYTTTTTCVAPAITSLAPSAGVAGQQIQVNGTNLIGADMGVPVVTFGANPATLVTSTSTRLVVVVPAGAGSVQVTVATCGGSANAPTPFVYCTAATIAAVTPSSGPSGTTVTITGTNLVGADGVNGTVTFGTQNAIVVNATPTALTVQAPAGIPSGTSVTVRVTTCGGTVTAGTTFLYTGPFDVTAIAPNAGVRSGGQAITLTGTGLTGVNVVTICGVACTSVTVVSDVQVTAITAAYAGPVPTTCDVVATKPGGLQDTLVAAYTYTVDVPDGTTFSAAGARTSPGAGGVAFRMTGIRMLATNEVSFGGRVNDPDACNVQAIDDNTVSGTAPAYVTPSGPFPATVQVFPESAAGADTTPVLFTYHANPTASDATGVVSGPGLALPGEQVILTGSNFRPATDDFVNRVQLVNRTMAGRVEGFVPFLITGNTTLTFFMPSAAVTGDVYDVVIYTPNGGITGCTTTPQYTFTVIGAITVL